MKRLLLSGLVSLALAPVAGTATDYFNPNGGVVTSPIDIHAANFTNYGTFNIGTAQPFETWDTLNFYNKGQMTCSPGWRFNTLSSANGSRQLAANFVNENPGVIRAAESLALGAPCNVAVYKPSYLFISATNIVTGAGTVSSGGASLIIGANGWLEMVGTNLNISRSGFGVVPVWDEPAGSSNTKTNFSPDIAMWDKYWVQTNFTKDYALNSAALWNGTNANAPGVPGGPPDGPCQPTSAPSRTLVSPTADSYINYSDTLKVTVTNSDGSTHTLDLITNMVKGAVFVGAPPEFDVQVGFSTAPNTALQTIGVWLSLTRSNAATALSSDANIFVEDTLASQGRNPSRGLLKNAVGCPANTLRPANYIFSRWGLSPGAPGNNGYPDPRFFIASGAKLLFTNDVRSDAVTNAVTEVGEYAAYSPFADNVVSRPTAVSGGAVTNLPGRIHIFSDTLDMTKARLRGEGEITIQTAHLISSTNAVVDCENLDFNLASTNGNLRVQNLSKDVVTRLRGQIYAWSAVWTNHAIVRIENYACTNWVSTNQGVLVTNTLCNIRSDLTNTIVMGLHVLILDATELQGLLPVSVYNFTTHSTNVVIHDNLSVIQNFAIDGKSLTLHGNLTFPGYYPPNPVTHLSPPISAIRNWTYPLAPNLLFFTNYGTLSIPNEAHFGDDRLQPYSVFTNVGLISAASIQLNSTNFGNSGYLFTQGSLIMQGGSGRLQDGSSFSGGEVQFLCDNLTFDNYQVLAANNAINFWVANSLSDAGPGSDSVLQAENGFNLYQKPATGDLLGTTLQSTAVDVPSVRLYHLWAGKDYGLNVAGYSNNVAVGRLVLDSISRDPLFVFAGTDEPGVSNALYVDYLELRGYATNRDAGGSFTNLQVDSNMRIYFAQAVVNGMSIAEKLDGQNSGRLRWVPSYAGYYSSTDFVYPDGTVTNVNAALVGSCELDSDGDGWPNCLDPTPFGEIQSKTIKLTLSVVNQPAPKAQISWQSSPAATNHVYYKNALGAANWQWLTSFVSSAAGGPVSVTDPINPASPRYYRVRVDGSQP